ncbi:tyrosine-protein phosphatase [Candidatus Bathyarchaeota archaeon]|nr:tyrosine-protein phosphatase [Candidatus Bathyarchaeota archaeon]
MLAALILLLVEAPHSAIVHDYVLTRIGAEPVRDILLGPLLGGTGPASLDNPGVRNICGVPPGAMQGLIKAVDEGFGGARGYLVKELGFSAEDVDSITAHLKVTPEAGV